MCCAYNFVSNSLAEFLEFHSESDLVECLPRDHFECVTRFFGVDILDGGNVMIFECVHDRFVGGVNGFSLDFK